jgi:hypothetical protein
MRFTIRLNNEAVLDQKVHLPHARNLHVPPHLQPGPAEPGVGENFQQRVGPGNNQIQHRPGAGIPVASEFAPEERQADVATAHSTLDHDEGFQFRQAVQCMDQDVGQSDDRKPRMPGKPAASMCHGCLGCRQRPCATEPGGVARCPTQRCRHWAGTSVHNP